MEAAGCGAEHTWQVLSIASLCAGAALTMLRHLPSLARAGLVARDLTGPFGCIVDQEVTNPWLRNLLDLECFVLRCWAHLFPRSF